ncbi:hypothetical protein KOW79_018519 [Hemibagrus wyckioides]|uniref:Uncharacterized protein n=1 Tax=Hemibagrus wyckioides TaxID=337641 RepID=A0A9D3N7S4_9TELE|nr:hypothetical protein KOW79_018519 [Hemibagrus wyckioides]
MSPLSASERERERERGRERTRPQLEEKEQRGTGIRGIRVCIQTHKGESAQISACDSFLSSLGSSSCSPVTGPQA